MEYLLLGGTTLGYLATLLLLRKKGRSIVRNLEILLRQESLLRHDETMDLFRRVSAVETALDAAKNTLKSIANMSDARSSLNGDAHLEFRNRLDTVEGRVDHTVKVVSELFTDPPAPKRAKRGK